MQDFLELALARQSCRKYADKPVEHEKLERCIEAARNAPSACNSQPWSFIVVETPELVAKVAECAQPNGANPFTPQARAFIVVLEEHAMLMPDLRRIMDSQSYALGDLGAAVLSICLEATSLGLGTCILGLYERERLRELLDISRDKHFAGLISVGYPASDKIRPKIRKQMEEIVRFI